VPGDPGQRPLHDPPALFTWKLDPTDVSRMAGHANYRTTLDMPAVVPN
jgi:hypothetical protein